MIENGITNKGCEYLANLLEKNFSLNLLHLGSKLIGPTGMHSIALGL